MSSSWWNFRQWLHWKLSYQCCQNFIKTATSSFRCWMDGWSRVNNIPVTKVEDGNIFGQQGLVYIHWLEQIKITKISNFDMEYLIKVIQRNMWRLRIGILDGRSEFNTICVLFQGSEIIVSDHFVGPSVRSQSGAIDSAIYTGVRIYQELSHITGLCTPFGIGSADYPIFSWKSQCHPITVTWALRRLKSPADDRLLSSLFRLTTRKISKPCIASLLWRECTSYGWIPHTKVQ